MNYLKVLFYKQISVDDKNEWIYCSLKIKCKAIQFIEKVLQLIKYVTS